MATIGKVSAVFTASTSGLVAGVNQAASSMRRIESSTASASRALRTLVAVDVTRFFAGVVSSAAGYVRSLNGLGQAQAEVIDKTSKMAARTGMTYGQFASLALAGDLAGVGMDTVALAATKADIAFVNASNGSKEAAAKFNQLGLSVDELAKMSPDQRFQAIAAAIAKLPTEAQQAAASVALFGRSGAELLPLFKDGADGIAKAREQAERLGLALTTAQGQDVEAMNDAFTLAGQAINGVIQQVVAYLSPALQQVADTFTNLIGDIGGANIGQAIGDALIQGARFLAGIGDWLIVNFSGVFDYLSKVGEQWGVVMDYANRIGNFFLGVFKTFEAAGNIVALAIANVASYLFSGAEEYAKTYGRALKDNIAEGDAAFARAFGSSATGIGQAVSGPLVSSLDAAVARAEASATKTEEAGKRAANNVASAVTAASEPQSVKGIDSRSKEGIAEMFRLMRGTGNDAAERTAAASERTADATEDLVGVFNDMAVVEV